MHGVEALTVLAFWATVLGQVVLPGVLLARGGRLVERGERALLLGQGATLGLALQGLALLAARALALPWLTTLVALAAAALGLALGRRREAAGPAPQPQVASPGADAATLAIALCAAALLPLASAARPAEPLPFDLLFHGGIAAELRHRWPLEDPRVAGVPLHYHLLAYALPVAAANPSGAPLADALFTLAPLFWLALLTLQIRNAGRALFGRRSRRGLGRRSRAVPRRPRASHRPRSGSVQQLPLDRHLWQPDDALQLRAAVWPGAIAPRLARARRASLAARARSARRRHERGQDDRAARRARRARARGARRHREATVRRRPAPGGGFRHGGPVWRAVHASGRTPPRRATRGWPGSGSAGRSRARDSPTRSDTRSLAMPRVDSRPGPHSPPGSWVTSDSPVSQPASGSPGTAAD